LLSSAPKKRNKMPFSWKFKGIGRVEQGAGL